VNQEHWEHELVYVEGGLVTRRLSVTGTSDWLPVPHKTVDDYIFSMESEGDGYQFCGSYPKDNGFVIAMKRLRRDL
jgi:hypothetical protein